MTGKAMCEYIADWIVEKGGPRLDPIQDIWKSSSTGELWHVFAMYQDAVADREHLDHVWDLRPGPERYTMYFATRPDEEYGRHPTMFILEG